MASVLIAALATAWLVLLIAAPGLPTMLATALYAIGSMICHQRPERSFHVDGAQLPVCARCVGVYAGAAVGSGVAHWPRAIRVIAGSSRALRPRALLALGLLPTVVTLAVEWSGAIDPGNIVRGAAGVPIGLAAALVLVPRLRVH